MVKPLVNTLAKVYKNIVRCKICGNIKSSDSNCTIKNCIYSSNKFCAGFRRLSILDVSSNADQPFTDKENNYILEERENLL